MFMTEKDYDHLFRQLCNLKKEAPCHNGTCVGYQQCEYSCYSGECAIDVVRTEAELKYNETKKEIQEHLSSSIDTIKTIMVNYAKDAILG